MVRYNLEQGKLQANELKMFSPAKSDRVVILVAESRPRTERVVPVLYSLWKRIEL